MFYSTVRSSCIIVADYLIRPNCYGERRGSSSYLYNYVRTNTATRTRSSLIFLVIHFQDAWYVPWANDSIFFKSNSQYTEFWFLFVLWLYLLAFTKKSLYFKHYVVNICNLCCTSYFIYFTKYLCECIVFRASVRVLGIVMILLITFFLREAGNFAIYVVQVILFISPNHLYECIVFRATCMCTWCWFDYDLVNYLSLR